MGKIWTAIAICAIVFQQEKVPNVGARRGLLSDNILLGSGANNKHKCCNINANYGLYLL